MFSFKRRRRRGELSQGDAAPPAYSYAVDYYSLGILTHEMLTLIVPLTADDVLEQLVRAPSLAPMRIEQSLSAELGSDERDLLIGLLSFDAGARLGGGALRAHPFFAQIEWGRLERLELSPPLPPFVDASVQ